MKILNLMIILCSLSLAQSAVAAGEFQVSPIRLDLGKTAKSGAITVSNMGNEKVNLQIQSVSWQQDAGGKDVYKETSDIVYFPKIVSLEKGDAQLIRVGMKGAAPESEKAYRLYIQEIPEPQKGGKKDGKTQVAISIRFGVPIFVKPENEILKGAIEEITAIKGAVTARVRNAGNTHFKILTVTVKGLAQDGREVFSRDLQGWYLLAGAARSYSETIPRDECSRITQMRVDVKAEELTFFGTHPVQREMCLP